jgi:hypothetical protein
MKRAAYDDTEPAGLSRVPVPRDVDAHDAAESDSRIAQRAPTDDERVRSLLDGLGASHSAGPVHAQPPVVFDDTMRAPSVRGETVHHAVTRRFETPARPQASSFERGVQRGLLVGVPAGFAIGVAVALGAVLLFVPVGGTAASSAPRPPAPSLESSGAPVPAAVVAPAAAPAARDESSAATPPRPRGSAQPSHDAPVAAPAHKAPADRPTTPGKNTMTNEL